MTKIKDFTKSEFVALFEKNDIKHRLSNDALSIIYEHLIVTNEDYVVNANVIADEFCEMSTDMIIDGGDVSLPEVSFYYDDNEDGEHFDKDGYKEACEEAIIEYLKQNTTYLGEFNAGGYQSYVFLSFE